MFFCLGVLSDSIETSMGWDKCENCMENVRLTFNQQIKTLGLVGEISFR